MVNIQEAKKKSGGDIQQINRSLNEGPPLASKLIIDFNESRFAVLEKN